MKRGIPKKYSKVRASLLCVALVVLSLLVYLVLFRTKAQAPETSRTTQSTPSKKNSQSTTSNTTKAFDKSAFSIDTPGSIWWIVNKKRPLPTGYVPRDLAVPSVSLRLAASSEQMQLSKQVIPSLEALFQAAKDAGVPLTLASGYRSEAYQRSLYNGYVARDGQAAADRYSAKPGTSEHQTGLAFDVCVQGSSCDLTKAFGETPTGQWVAEHAHEYGFIVHYQNGKEASTGYDYEPWHLRYVGNELAGELYKTGQTLEEFFGL
mgnify:CR=1 FL=1